MNIDFRAFFCAAALGIVVTLVAGCGGGDTATVSNQNSGGPAPGTGGGSSGGSQNPPPAAGSVQLQSASVTGYSPAGQVPVRITPAIDNGDFTIDWAAQVPDPNGFTYFTRLILSDDPVLDLGTDIEFGLLVCFTNGYPCRLDNSIPCRFTNTNLFSCNLGATTPRETDISSLLPAIPQTVYLIVAVCDGLLSGCDYRPIELRLE